MTKLYLNDSVVKIVVEADKKTATNNGEELIMLSATVTEGDEAIVACPVVFHVDGRALFNESSSSYYSTLSNGTGTAFAHVKSKTSESNKVLCFLRDDDTIFGEVSVSFHEPFAPLTLRRVYNSGHDLYNYEPSIVWPGAEFFVEVQGGSSELSWSGFNGELNGIELFASGSVCKVQITGEFYGMRGIVAHDTVTGESVTHIFSVEHFIYANREALSLDKICTLYPRKKIIKKEIYLELFRLWGDMSHYHGWSGEYWTAGYLPVFDIATIFDVEKGTSRTTTITDRKFKFAYTEA